MHVISHFAYLDAGTGSLIIQSLIGIVAGVAVFSRRIIFAIRSKIPGLSKKGEESTKKTAKK